MADKNLSIQEFLIFNETADWNQVFQSADDTIVFTETLHINPFHVKIAQKLFFTQTRFEPVFGNRTIAVGQSIPFTQVGTDKQLTVECYQNIFFIQYAEPRPSVSQTLFFTQSVSLNKADDIDFDFITFIDNADYILFNNTGITDTLLFEQYARITKLNKYYINPTVPATVEKLYDVDFPSHTTRIIQLSYGTLVVRIPAPEIGDTDKIERTRIARYTRAGDYITYTDPIWAETHTLSYRFSFLSRAIIDQIREFCRKTIGQTIQLIDYENRIWNVVINNPALEYEQSGRNNYTTIIEFQGIKT